MGNDIAGGKVTPALELVDSPQCMEQETQPDSNVFPMCAITWAQVRKNENNHENDDDVCLADTVFLSAPTEKGEKGAESAAASPPETMAEPVRPASSDGTTLPVTHERLRKRLTRR